MSERTKAIRFARRKVERAARLLADAADALKHAGLPAAARQMHDASYAAATALRDAECEDIP